MNVDRFGNRQRLPVILQGQPGECGLAALTMIAHYYGQRVELRQLRRRFLISSRGSSLENLIRVAHALNFETRALSLELDALEELTLPCVLHWNFNHFVVLKRVSKGVIQIHDPAVGDRRLTRSEFGKHFTGVALELAPARDFRPARAAPRLRLSSLIGSVVGLKGSFMQVVGLALGMELVLLALPFQLQWVVDHALVGADRSLIVILGVGFLALVALQAAITALRGWLISTLANQVNFQWLSQAFTHLLRLPIAYFDSRHLGGIQSRFASINHIQHTLTNSFIQALVDGGLVVGTLGMMAVYSLPLSALAAVVLASSVGLRACLFRPLREATTSELGYDAMQHTHFLETVRGIQSVRLFGRDQERRMGWQSLLADRFSASLSVSRIGVAQQTFNTLLFGAERIIAVWVGALAVLDNELSIGMLFAFLAYKEQFAARSLALVEKLYELRMLGLHMERVADIVLSEPEEDARAGASGGGSVVNPSTACIELHDVAFRYAQSEPFVVSDVNLSISPGECVAITGTSGCGKSTLLKLLLGLSQPTHGRVSFGGQPITQFGLSDYRALIGTVMQDDCLYTGSLADNIAFFDPIQDFERVEECARLSAIHDTITSMPMGYDSLIADNGSGLSGGQRQRILLARALYKRPRILILDEATSHLDLLSERAVNDAIRKMNLTRIIVAHRPDTIQMADRVITLENGKVKRDIGLSQRGDGAAGAR